MGRAPCCSKVGLHRGPWTPREDTLLTKYIQAHGEGHWRSLPKNAGLLRCGKSCRLRWMNYLRPDIKRGNITPDEDDLIIRLHSLLGNRWSLIAGRLPGRTDNEIKNYWNTYLSKRLRSQGTDPDTHKKILDPVIQGTKRIRSNNNKNKNNIKGNKNKNDKSAKTSSSTTAAAIATTSENHVGPETKPKVHLPKPTRVLSSFSLVRNYSFEGNTTCGSNSSQEKGEGGVGDQEVEVPNWLSFKDNDDHNNGVGFDHHDQLVNHHDDHPVNDHDQFQCQSDHQMLLPPIALSQENSTLEKLYDEYLELLKTEDYHDQVELDSFAESLLI